MAVSFQSALFSLHRVWSCSLYAGKKKTPKLIVPKNPSERFFCPLGVCRQKKKNWKKKERKEKKKKSIFPGSKWDGTEGIWVRGLFQPPQPDPALLLPAEPVASLTANSQTEFIISFFFFFKKHRNLIWQSLTPNSQSGLSGRTGGAAFAFFSSPPRAEKGRDAAGSHPRPMLIPGAALRAPAA